MEGIMIRERIRNTEVK